MIRDSALAAILCLCAVLGQQTSHGDETLVPPNIVFILADDLGWSDLSVYQPSPIETPHLERLAAEGVRFTDFYAAAPVCSPTRASIITGWTPARVGITDFIPGHWRPFERLTVPEMPGGLPPQVPEMGAVLGEAGYRTGYFGKWHLGRRNRYPDTAGFEQYAVTSGGHRGPRVRVVPEGTVPEGVWLIDWLTEQGITFIEQGDDRPFFLFLAHYAPHIPLDAPEALIEKYRAVAVDEDRVWNPTYAAMIEQIDSSIGRLLTFLETTGRDRETLVVFTSDNGGLRRTFTGKGEDVTENTPLRDEKGSLYEGGIRVPMIVRWPGHFPANRIVSMPAMSVDFLPTFIEFAGSSVDALELSTDGRSLARLWRNPSAFVPVAPLYFHYPHYHQCDPAGAVRLGRWKLIEYFAPERIELYDLNQDIGETHNLASEQPEMVERLRQDLLQWRERTGAAMPEPNPRFDPEKAGDWWSRGRNAPLAP